MSLQDSAQQIAEGQVLNDWAPLPPEPLSPEIEALVRSAQQGTLDPMAEMQLNPPEGELSGPREPALDLSDFDDPLDPRRRGK
jgi:hypothetical protein